MEQNTLDTPRTSARRVRFGSFEVDLNQQELFNRGIRIALQHKPFRILELLLKKRGVLVTREELAHYLWPNLHVSFDRGLNTAVNVLRRALGDSPSNCRYIETRSGLGYRFIAHVEEIPAPDDDEARQLPSRPAASFEGYQDYLKGRLFCDKMTEEALWKSIAHYEAALESDPGYALANAGLSNSYIGLATLGVLSSTSAYGRARQYALAALEADPDLAESHAALAGVMRSFEWNWMAAETEYLTALDLNPRCADARRWYASLLCCMGRFEDSRREFRRALEADPLSIGIATESAWNFYMCRDFEAAIEQSWKALTLEPTHALAQHALGLACQQLGRFEDAVIELHNSRVCSGHHPVAIASLAHAHAASGSSERSLELLRELEEIASRRLVSNYWMAVAHTGLGACDAAFGFLQKAVDERDVWLSWLKVEPRFNPLAADPRFHRILQRVGLT